MSLWESFFSSVVSLRKTLYKKGVLKSYKLPVKVLSVGNITFGGTGKSPFVSFLLDKFSGQHKIAVLSRGYGRKSKGFYKVDPKKQKAAADFGDEPVMLALKHPHVSFYVCEDRVLGVENILKLEKPQWIFLDDAFQNLKIKKDINTVLVDATEDFKNYHFPPAGRLRNNTQDIFEADLRFLTKTNLVTAKKIEDIKKMFKCSDFIEMESHVDVLQNPVDGKKLTPQKVVLISGIAKPKNFEKSVQDLGFEIVKHNTFKDHHRFTLSEIEVFVEEAKGYPIVTTEKDYAKLKEFNNFTFYVSQLKLKEKSSLEKLYGLIN